MTKISVPIKAVIRDWVESILIAFVLAMFIRTFFFQAFKIPSGSMKPTLQVGDRLIVNKLTYGAKIPFTKERPGMRLPGFREPRRGDVVVFVFPEDPERDFIKRLIATGGETVEIKNGEILIDGQRIEMPVIDNIYYYNRGPYGQPGVAVEVPQGYYFVMGDNSASSHDSRYWGFVPARYIIGKAELIFWPLNRIRFIK